MQIIIIAIIILFVCSLPGAAYASNSATQPSTTSLDAPLLSERVGILEYTTDLEKKLRALQKPQNWSEAEWNKQLEKAQNEEIHRNLLLQLASFQQQQGMYQMAEDTYKQAAKENPSDPLIQLALIKLYADKKDLAEVESALNYAIKKFPQEETFDILRLKLLFQKRDFQTTGNVAQSALKKFPRNELIHLISIVTAMAEKNNWQALANATAGTKACPDSAMLHAMHAVTLMGNNLLEEARFEVEKALRIDNKCLTAQLIRVYIYDRENNTKAAAHTMKQIVELSDYNRTFVIQYVRYLIKASMEEQGAAPLLMVAANDIIDVGQTYINKSGNELSDANSLEQLTIQKNITSQYLKHGLIRQYLFRESRALISDLFQMFSHLPASAIRTALKQVNDYPGTDNSHTLAKIIAGDVLWLLHRDKLASDCYKSAAISKLPSPVAASAYSRFLLDCMNKPEACLQWWQTVASYPSLNKQAEFNIAIRKRNIANRRNDIAGRIKSRQKALLRMFEGGAANELLNPASGPMRSLKQDCVNASISQK